jgi:CheY-like chemotaxis protein
LAPVLSDQTLRLLNGLDLTRRLRQFRPGLPVILTTRLQRSINR